MEKKIYHALEDSRMEYPYIDAEEIRERKIPNQKPVTYRYLHGGFEDTGIKFVFCIPMKEAFRGRFFQYLSPFPGPEEEIASLDKTGEDDKVAFTLMNGACFVESNMGSEHAFGGAADATLCYKASAMVAEYCRIKIMELYGCDRPYGYVYGGSGGGYKTIACIENTDAWDGAVPYVIGSPASLPNTISMHVQGERVLRHKFPQIVDAVDVGGTGDMYQELTHEEAAMLKELTLMGYPPRTWFMEADGIFASGSLPVLLPGVKAKDPTFFTDFWTKDGYAGADPDSSAVRDRIKFHSVVKAVHLPGEAIREAGGQNGVDTAWKKMLAQGRDAWLELEKVPESEDLYLDGCELILTSGEAAGTKLSIAGIKGKGIMLGNAYGFSNIEEAIAGIELGDKVLIDNSDFIAVQYYYRHQVPQDKNFHAWDQFRDEAGNPILPQRPELIGPGYCGTGTVQDGRIQGKVIVIQSLMDESTTPWCGDWYRNTVRDAQGNEENFRLYYMDRCMHGDVAFLENHMITNYLGALRQALLDISDWVERGVEPRESSHYQMNGGQVIIEPEAQKRKGIQPVIQLLANGDVCAHVKAGEAVKFTVKVIVPDNAGIVTAVDYALEANHEFSMEVKEFYPVHGTFHRITEDGLEGATAVLEHVYDQPGTYFAVVRVKMNRHGDGEDIFTQVKNIARVRIIVV